VRLIVDGDRREPRERATVREDRDEFPVGLERLDHSLDAGQGDRVAHDLAGRRGPAGPGSRRPPHLIVGVRQGDQQGAKARSPRRGGGFVWLKGS